MPRPGPGVAIPSPSRPTSRRPAGRARDRRRRPRRRLRRRRRLDRGPAVVDARRPRSSRRPPCSTAGSRRGRRSAGSSRAEVPAADRPGELDLARPTGRERHRRDDLATRLGRSSCSTRERRSATAARSSRSTPSPATSRRPSARRPTATSGRTAASWLAERSSGPVREPRAPAALRRRRHGRDLVRERRHGVPQRAGDAGRRAARPDPLCRLVQRLVTRRRGRGGRPRARQATGRLIGRDCRSAHQERVAQDGSCSGRSTR